MNRVLNFKKRTGQLKELGELVFLEGMKDISFEIKRIYYTHSAKAGVVRGRHAHKKLEQLLICVYGVIKVMCDDSEVQEYYTLDDPAKGLYVGPGIWHTMKWLKDDSVLLVLASDYYDESDYVRDYDEFIKLAKEGYWK